MNNCDSPGLLPIKAALENMLSLVTALKDFETIPLLAANKRILAQDILSPINVPPADNSAMDGYALKVDDLNSNNNQLQLIGSALAGVPYSGELQAGQCIRIMTGAVIPTGANAVVMQEQTEQIGDMIHFSIIPAPGNNIRRAGDDIRAGENVLTKGTKLAPVHLSLLASLGEADVSVVRKVKVALLATGDELTSPGSPLTEGAIYESNRYALHAMLEELGIQVQDMGIVSDNKDALRATFLAADQSADLVISSGGVSVGDADYVKDILDELGQVNFWKVAIKPGKPFAFGRLKHAWFCGLPGNPVSSYVTFQQLVMPILTKLAGETAKTKPSLTATTSGPISKQPGRTDYQRGTYFADQHGKLIVSPGKKQGSGIISSIAQANCFIVLEQNSGNLPAGSSVTIQPFDFIN